MSRFELHSFLSREECVRRLRHDVDSIWRIRSHRPLSGAVHGSSFWFFERAKGRNPFVIVLSARLSDEARGTRILQLTLGASVLFLVYAFAAGAPLKLATLALWSAYLSVQGWLAHRGVEKDKARLLAVLRNRLGAS